MKLKFLLLGLSLIGWTAFADSTITALHPDGSGTSTTTTDKGVVTNQIIPPASPPVSVDSEGEPLPPSVAPPATCQN